MAAKKSSAEWKTDPQAHVVPAWECLPVGSADVLRAAEKLLTFYRRCTPNDHGYAGTTAWCKECQARQEYVDACTRRQLLEGRDQ